MGVGSGGGSRSPLGIHRIRFRYGVALLLTEEIAFADAWAGVAV